MNSGLAVSAVSVGVALAALLAYDTFVVARALAVGREVAAESRAFAASPDSAAHTLLVVGDSTGVGTGSRDPGDSIAGRLAGDFPRLHVDNLAENGATTAAVGAQLANAPRARYDVVLVQVGGNDVLRLTATEALQDHIRSALRSAQARGAQVVLMSTGRVGDAPAIPWPLSVWMTQRAAQVRELFAREAAARGAHYVNLFTEPGERNPFRESPDAHYARDGLHPSGAGYAAWYRRLRDQVPMADWLAI